MKKRFRFQDLEIWKDAIVLTDELLDIADDLEERKFFRFSEQLRSAAMSMSNNIAEGSGSLFHKEFVRFLDISRKSTFENANIIIILHRRNLIEPNKIDELLDKLELLCRKITSFQKTLRS